LSVEPSGRSYIVWSKIVMEGQTYSFAGHLFGATRLQFVRCFLSLSLCVCVRVAVLMLRMGELCVSSYHGPVVPRCGCAASPQTSSIQLPATRRQLIRTTVAVTAALHRIYCRQAAVVALTRWDSLPCRVPDVTSANGVSQLRHLLRVVSHGLPVPSNRALHHTADAMQSASPTHDHRSARGLSSPGDEPRVGDRARHSHTTDGSDDAPSRHGLDATTAPLPPALPPSTRDTTPASAYSTPAGRRLRHPQLPGSGLTGAVPPSPVPVQAPAPHHQRPPSHGSPPQQPNHRSDDASRGASGGRGRRLAAREADPRAVLDARLLTSHPPLHPVASTLFSPSAAVAAMITPLLRKELDAGIARGPVAMLAISECVGQLTLVCRDHWYARHGLPHPMVSSPRLHKGDGDDGPRAGEREERGHTMEGSSGTPDPLSRVVASARPLEVPNLRLACCLLRVLLRHAGHGGGMTREAADPTVSPAAASRAWVRSLLYTPAMVSRLLFTLQAPHVHGPVLSSVVQLLSHLLRRPQLFQLHDRPFLAPIFALELAFAHQVQQQRTTTTSTGAQFAHSTFLQGLAELLAISAGAAHDFAARWYREAASGLPLCMSQVRSQSWFSFRLSCGVPGSSGASAEAGANDAQQSDSGANAVGRAETGSSVGAGAGVGTGAGAGVGTGAGMGTGAGTGAGVGAVGASPASLSTVSSPALSAADAVVGALDCQQEQSREALDHGRRLQLAIGGSTTIRDLGEVLSFLDAAESKTPVPLYRLHVMSGDVVQALLPKLLESPIARQWIHSTAGMQDAWCCFV